MPLTTIPLVGLASNDPVPGNYVAVNFAQGPASSGQTNYSVIMLANRLSTGSGQDDGYVYGPDTQVQMSSEQDMINLSGVGSEAHRMWRRFNKVNKSSSLYVIFVKESTGNQATGAITPSVTATGPGTLRIIIDDTVIDTGIASGDTAATVGANAVININANINLPVTASGTSVITITAKQRGLRGNFIRYSAQILPATGVGTTVTPVNRTLMSGGTVADSNVNALATIANTRYYYQVSAAEDATQVGNLSTQLNSNAAPIVGLRCRGVAGSVDTVANATTVATGLNQARGELVWQQNSDWTPAELAANAAAVYSLFETSLGDDHSLNYDYFGSDAVTSQFWFVPAPLDGTVPSRSQVKSALLNGITPISVSRPGVSTLVKRITTRSLSGSQPDYRIRDAHKVTISDVYADDLLAKAQLQFSGKSIGDDPAQGQLPPAPSVVTPRQFLAMINQLTVEYLNRGLLQNADQIVAATQVIREASPRTRFSARVPLQTIDILDQTATNVDQVG